MFTRMIYTYNQKQIARIAKADLYIFGTRFDPRVTRCGSVLFRYLINESGPSGHPPPATLDLRVLVCYLCTVL